MRFRPFIGTLFGLGMGVVTIILWMVTFQPHGGAEWSHYLFPVSALILERMYYPTQPIPVPLWYAGALLEWLILGLVVDLLRKAFRRKTS